MQNKNRIAIDHDIERLLTQATAEPGRQDPLGMVGFAATWAAASPWMVSHAPSEHEHIWSNDEHVQVAPKEEKPQS